jgi:hypothetical protein
MSNLLLKRGFVLGLIVIFIGLSLISGASGNFIQENKKFKDNLVNVDFAQIPDYNKDGKSTTGPLFPIDVGKELDLGLIGDTTLIQKVPSYLWYHGCGPTAAGMVIGYWDGQGYEDLVEGNASYQTKDVNKSIASQGNYVDYCLPIDYYPDPISPDKSEPPIGDEHDDNCLADFMKTSQSFYSNYYGWSWFKHVNVSLLGYINWTNPEYDVTVNNLRWGDLTWNNFRTEIDAGNPVVLLVDTDGNGWTDHFITAIGYDDSQNYACYNTWDTDIHWYEFAEISYGQPWGIYGATFCSFQNNPPDLPTIDGPDSGKPGVEYEYCINATDPDNDVLFVIWNWGDGTSGEWIGPLVSGMQVCDSHSWDEKGTFNISVTVRDEHGESVTSYKEVIIPRTRITSYSILYWFIERFPMLEKLVNLIKIY